MNKHVSHADTLPQKHYRYSEVLIQLSYSVVTHKLISIHYVRMLTAGSQLLKYRRTACDLRRDISTTSDPALVVTRQQKKQITSNYLNDLTMVCNGGENSFIIRVSSVTARQVVHETL